MYKIVVILTQFLYLGSVLSFFLNWKKVNHSGFKWIVVYTIVMCCSDIILYLLAKQGIHNHLVINTYILVASILLMYYYLKKGTALSAYWIYIFLALCVVSWIVEMLLIDDVHSTSAKATYTLLSAVVITLSVSSLLKRKVKSYTYSRWVDSSLLLFFGITLVVKASASFEPLTSSVTFYVDWIQLSVNLTYSCILIYGAWKQVES